MFVFIRRSQIGLVTSDIIPQLLLMYSQWAFSPYFLCENMHEGKPFSFLKPGCSSRLFPANLQTELRSCSCKMSPQPEIMGREGELVLTVLVQTFPLISCAIWRFSQDILHLFLWLFLILFTGAEGGQRQLVTMPWNQTLISSGRQEQTFPNMQEHTSRHTQTNPGADSSRGFRHLIT